MTLRTYKYIKSYKKVLNIRKVNLLLELEKIALIRYNKRVIGIIIYYKSNKNISKEKKYGAL